MQLTNVNMACRLPHVVRVLIDEALLLSQLASCMFCLLATSAQPSASAPKFGMLLQAV
jgi:hypothetical protein